VVQLRVTPKTRNPFTTKALSIFGVTWKWHFLNHALLLAKAWLSAVPDAPACQRQGRELACHAGRNACRSWPRDDAAADAGVHRPLGRHGKQDCERNAARRWHAGSAAPQLAAHGDRVKALRPVYLGDDLFACQPMAEAITGAGGDFLLTAKPSSHKTLYDFMQGAQLDEHTVTQKTNGKRLTYRFRWFEGAPLRDAHDAVLVNWVGVTITDAKGHVTYDNAFVTSLPVTRDTAAEIVACARARWKVEPRGSPEIENESFNVLKSNGYHLEHNFGHGKQNLAMMFAAMNLLAFALHTICDALEQLWINARTAKRARTRFFEHIRTITAYLVFPNWTTLHADPDRLKTAAPRRGRGSESADFGLHRRAETAGLFRPDCDWQGGSRAGGGQPPRVKRAGAGAVPGPTG